MMLARGPSRTSGVQEIETRRTFPIGGRGMTPLRVTRLALKPASAFGYCRGMAILVLLRKEVPGFGPVVSG